MGGLRDGMDGNSDIKIKKTMVEVHGCIDGLYLSRTLFQAVFFLHFLYPWCWQCSNAVALIGGLRKNKNDFLHYDAVLFV